MSTAVPVAPAGDTLPMKVANMTFLVMKLGEECAPLQYVRELTQNGIEGIEQLPGNGPGEVIWDVDWNYHVLSDGVFKLSCIDTGIGMTGPEMVKFINELSSSIHEQSSSGNFGVGAKIAAAPRNPHGLVYMSWKNGVGHMIHLWLDPEEKVFGLKRWPQNGGEFWTPVSDDLKPQHIQGHGTVVVLLGKSDDHDTMEPPQGTHMRSRWILRYLNTRYFRFPKGVTVKAREGWELPKGDQHSFLRVVQGAGEWLDKNSQSSGVVSLSDAKAHWWIIRHDVDQNSGHFASGGHVAALYQNELYEMTAGRGTSARLMAFGAIFGSDRVVIYVEPTGNSITSNTARTQLLIGGDALDWPRWATEFRDNLPDEIVQLQEQLGALEGEKDYKKKISERLKEIRDLLRFSRFKPAKDGSASVVEKEMPGGEPAVGAQQQVGVKEPGTKGGKAGDIYSLFAEAGGDPANPVTGMNEPKVQWQSLENGTRAPGALEDRAARFVLNQNTLVINADFRVFTDMVDRWAAAYAKAAGAKATVREVVHEWFEQQLVETVMSAMALKATGKWSLQELEQLWSEEALTAAVLPRWHIDQSIRRNLGTRLGSLKVA
jgi:Fe2+ transport system protein FeoA